MRIVTDTKRVTRNLTIARYATIGGIVLLVGALLVNLYALSRPNDVQLLIYVIIGFFVGYTLSNVGGVLNMRWARRPDKGLADALRGLDDRHTLYNFRLGAAHALIAPSGVYVLHPKFQTGPIQFAAGKWTNPGARPGFGRLFGPRDTLGNPVAEAKLEVDALQAFLKKHLPDVTVEPRPLIVFMHPRAVLDAGESPVPTLHVKQLKDFIRRQPKTETLPTVALTDLEAKLGFAAAE